MHSAAMPRMRLGRPPALLVPTRHLRQLVSFETAFALFFFSNQLETLLGTDLDLTAPAFVLSVLAGAVVMLREGLNLRALPTTALGLLFVLWCVVSFAWTPSRLFAPVKTVPLVTFVVWTIVASSLIIGPSRERVVRLFVLMLGLAALLVAKGLMIYALYGGFRQVRSQIWDAEDAATRIYLTWGRGVGPGALLAFLIAVYARPFSQRQLLGLGLFAGCAFFLLVGGGRGPFLAVAAACLLPLLLGTLSLQPRQGLPRSQMLTLMLLAGAGLAVMAVILSGTAPDTLRRMGSLITQLGDEDRIVHSYDRVAKFARAWAGWASAPVAGHGIGSFPLVSMGRESVRGDYPHNIVLELLFEFGLVGLMLFGLYALASLSRVSLARLRADPVQLGCLMIFANAMLNAMTSSDLTGNLPVYLGLGLLLVPRHRARGLQPGLTLARRQHLWNKVVLSLLDVLRLHDAGQAARAKRAEARCAAHGEELRDALARSGLSLEDEEVAIAAAVRTARRRFAQERALEQERQEALPEAPPIGLVRDVQVWSPARPGRMRPRRSTELSASSAMALEAV